MKKRRLGCSGLVVSEVSLGAMSFGMGFTRDTNVDERLAARLVHRALDAGVNLFDSAETYAQGRSEEVLGRALRGRRDDVLLVTKVGFADLDPGALSYDNVVAACEASLHRLGVDHVDLYLLHRADRATPIEETLRALDDLMSRGLVGQIGVDNYRAWEIAGSVAHRRALQRPAFSAVEVYLSLIGRQAEHEILPYARTEDLGVLVHSPLAGGLLTSRNDTPGTRGRRRVGGLPEFDPTTRNRALAVLERIACAHAVSMAQIALAWVLAQPGIATAIVGARTVEQLDDNLAAADLELHAEETAQLDAATAPDAMYPATVDHQWGFPEPPYTEGAAIPERLVRQDGTYAD